MVAMLAAEPAAGDQIRKSRELCVVESLWTDLTAWRRFVVPSWPKASWTRVVALP